MTQMTTAQARVIDPILTTVAQGYQNSEMVGMALFPSVPVGARGGKILQFGKEDFRLYNTARSPGANTKRIQYGYLGLPYALEQHALEAVVPFENDEEAKAIAGVDIAGRAVNGQQDIMALRLEYAQAAIALNAANYSASNKVTLSGASQWSDYSGTSNPTKDINTAKDAIRAKTGKRPTVAILGPTVFSALTENPLIKARFQYTSSDSITTEMLAKLWGLKQVLVGDAIYEDATGTMQDVWGKSVVLAFAQTATAAQRGLPSYGYSYRLRGYPLVEQSYVDRNAKSDIYPVTDEVAPVLCSADSGYLISAAVA